MWPWRHKKHRASVKNHEEVMVRLDEIEEKQAETERRLDNLSKEVEVITRPWRPSSQR